MTKVPPCVGAQELGRMLGVNRQRVQQIVTRPDFPEPAYVFAMGKAWLVADVQKWAKKRGRTLNL